MTESPPSGSGSRTGTVPLLLGALALIAVVAVLVSSRRAPASVVLYCAQDQVFAEPLLAGFEAATGVRVRAVFDSEAVKTVGLANRLLAEQGHPVADVFWGNEELRTRQLASRGVFGQAPRWTAFGQRTRRLVMPEVVPDGWAPPESFRELTNVRFRGRLSMAYPLFGTTATHFLVLRQRWGESNWLAWCEALAANKPFIEEGNSQVVRRVARGEALVGLTDSDDIEAARREGLAVVALPPDLDSLRIPNTVALVPRNGGVSPEAQRLFDHLTSEAVRRELEAVGALEEPGTGPEPVAPDWERLLAELDSGTDQLKNLFRR